MRNLKLLTVFASAIIFFASCNTEYAEPKISLDAPSGEVVDFSEYDEKPVLFNVVVEAEAGIDDLRVERFDYVGEEFTKTLTILIDNEDEWKGAENYEYTFDQPISKSDFEDGVTKVEFEFIVKDSEGLLGYTTYSITQTAYFTVEFEVKDALGNDIENAIVTLNDETNEAGDYTFNNVYAGNYSYSVVKEGYINVTGEVNVTENKTETVELWQNISDYTGNNIILAAQSQLGYANYNGDDNVANQNETIGVKYKGTAAGTITVETTENADGWVVFEGNVENLNYYHQLYEIYNDDEATIVTELTMNVPEQNFKSEYTPIYFVSKVGDNYVFVKNLDGVRDGENGNVLVFDYKTLEE